MALYGTARVGAGSVPRPARGNSYAGVSTSGSAKTGDGKSWWESALDLFMPGDTTVGPPIPKPPIPPGATYVPPRKNYDKLFPWQPDPAGRGLGRSAGSYQQFGPGMTQDEARQNSLYRNIGFGDYGNAMAGAAADRAGAQADLEYNNSLYGPDGTSRQSLTNSFNYNENMYGVNRGENDVRLGAINRQPGYLGDMRNIDAWRTVGDVRTIDIANAANERQFGLINAARGDVGANRDRELERLTGVQSEIGRQEVAAKRDEKLAQWKAFSDAAAAGNISAVAQMNSGQLHSALKDNLATFQEQRAQAKRDTDQANQDYATKMRELQEQEATATDARELGKIRREMRMLDEQASKRKYQEDLAQVEDEKKLNYLNLMGLEYGRRRDQEDFRIGNVGFDNRQNYGYKGFAAAEAKTRTAENQAENDWRRVQADYPTKTHWYDPFGMFSGGQ